MSAWKRGLKHEHIFVVLRAETGEQQRDWSIEGRVTTTKAFLDQAEAEAEVERLNRLNADKQCLYFWGVARLRRPEGGQRFGA